MKHALFAGLVFNERDQPAEVVYLGETPFYVILDDDFRRHVEARAIDSQVMRWLRDRIMEHQEIVTEQAMKMIGRDDLFTKAMLDSSLRNIDRQIDQMIEIGLPEAARAWLGMMGFRVVVDVHGQVVSVNLPAEASDEDDD